MEVFHGTTIVSARRGSKVAMGGDGQVTLGNIVVKQGAKKVRRLHHDRILAGFAGATADAFTLLERLEAKGCAARDRSEAVHRFAAAIGRDDLIGKRLQAVAETLCGGSLTPLLSHLVGAEGLSEKDRRALRARPDTSRLPVLVLTTEAGDDLKQMGRAAGATGWLLKPFDPIRLVEVLRKVAPQAAQETP